MYVLKLFFCVNASVKNLFVLLRLNVFQFVMKVWNNYRAKLNTDWVSAGVFVCPFWGAVYALLRNPTFWKHLLPGAGRVPTVPECACGTDGGCRNVPSWGDCEEFTGGSKRYERMIIWNWIGRCVSRIRSGWAASVAWLSGLSIPCWHCLMFFRRWRKVLYCSCWTSCWRFWVWSVWLWISLRPESGTVNGQWGMRNPGMITGG